MKIFCLSILLCSFLNAHCQDFYIKGNVNWTNNSSWHPTVYLLKINNLEHILSGSVQLVVDSAVIARDGSFKFNNPNVIEDNILYRLNVIKKSNIGNGGALHMLGTTEGFAFLLLTQKSKIEFTTNIEHFNYALKPIAMDAANRAIFQFHKMQRPDNELLDIFIQQRTSLDTLATYYKDSMNAIRANITQLIRSSFAKYKTFADTVGNPYAAILSTAYFDKKDSVLTQKLAKRFLKEIPHSRYTGQYIAAVKNEAVLNVGAAAPEINMRDLNGKQFLLSQCKGKYVFIDFWASWCLPCRAENKQTLLPLYTQLDTGKIIFISISQDVNEQNWKKAIADDQINVWINACDTKGAASQTAIDYNVTELPTNYLINPNGIIIARNLRSAELGMAIVSALSGLK